MTEKSSRRDLPNSARVRITFRETAANDRGGGSFWMYVQDHLIKRNYPLKGLEPEVLEKRFRERFGTVLHDLLVEKFKRGTFAFAFEVVGQIAYGTMSFDLSIVGVKGFLEFFDSNSELFQIAFNQYCPMALAMVFSGLSDTDIDGISCSIDPSPTLSDAFARNASEVPGSTGSAQDREGLASRLRRSDAMIWLWVVSNASLLVPVALALVILYVTFQALEKDREEFHNGVVTLQERQTEVIRLLASQKEAEKTAGSEKAGDSKTAAK